MKVEFGTRNDKLVIFRRMIRVLYVPVWYERPGLEFVPPIKHLQVFSLREPKL